MASPDRHLSLWETAKSELRNTFSRSDYDTWISTLQAVGIVDGNILVLEAPTVLTEAWVNSNYGEILRRHLRAGAQVGVGDLPAALGLADHVGEIVLQRDERHAASQPVTPRSATGKVGTAVMTLGGNQENWY